MKNWEVFCAKCSEINCKNNESCIHCGTTPLAKSVMDINTKIVIDFLREKGVLSDDNTKLTIVKSIGTEFDIVKLMTELLTRRERDL